MTHSDYHLKITLLKNANLSSYDSHAWKIIFIDVSSRQHLASFLQFDDIGSVLDKAQKSLDTQQSKSASKHDTTLSEGFKVFESKKFGIKIQHPSNWDDYEETGPADYSPDRIYRASFSSPSNKDFMDTVFTSFQIDKLASPTTLEK